MANGYGGGYGSADLLQIVDFIRGLTQERTAKRAVNASPQLLGIEGPSAGPIDPAIFGNPAFQRMLATRTGQLDAEAQRKLAGATTEHTGAATAEQLFQTEQQKSDAGRLGGVSTPAFSAMTAREGVKQAGTQFEQTLPLEARKVGVAEAGVGVDKEKLKLLENAQVSEGTQKMMETLGMLGPMLLGKDSPGIIGTILKGITTGPYSAVGTAVNTRDTEKKKAFEDAMKFGGTTTAPGAEAPPAPGNVFANPTVKAAFERYAQANNLYLPGMSPENARVAAMAGGQGFVPRVQSAQGPQDVTKAATNVQQRILELLSHRGQTPQNPTEEKSFAASQGALPRLSTDYATFVDAARALGVKDTEQFNQLMLQLQELGMVPKRGQ